MTAGSTSSSQEYDVYEVKSGDTVLVESKDYMVEYPSGMIDAGKYEIKHYFLGSPAFQAAHLHIFVQGNLLVSCKITQQ